MHPLLLRCYDSSQLGDRVAATDAHPRFSTAEQVPLLVAGRTGGPDTCWLAPQYIRKQHSLAKPQYQDARQSNKQETQ
jgi:hypothetical protein